MGTELFVAGELKSLIASINQEHQLCIDAIGTALERAAAVGEKLSAAKEQVKAAGLNWQRWADENLKFSRHQASKYIRAAAWGPTLLGQNGTASSCFTLEEGVKVLGGSDPNKEPSEPPGEFESIPAGIEALRTTVYRLADRWKPEFLPALYEAMRTIAGQLEDDFNAD